MFKPGSDSLYDFFNKPGVAYYIPFYQRQYSWDKEDVEKLMDDLYDGVKKICTQSDYLRFIGTVILLEESNPQINQHFDISELITRIKNVIDGQQRLCTLAILSILLSEELLTIKKEICSNKWDTLGSVPDLLTTIDNRILDLEEFYSLEVRKTNVDPERKPIIIRALSTNVSPNVDQWTLNGDFSRYYQSDVAKFIAHYIVYHTILDDISNEKLIVVIKEIKQWLNKTRIGSNYPSAEVLVGFNNRGSNLENFIDGVIDLQSLNQKSQDCYKIVCGAIKLLALLRFLTHKTFLTWIECPNEDLAFDMFQSLNATGTPLTAIEVFKPMVVNTLGQNYSNSDTKSYFDKIDEFFDAKKTSILKEKYTDEILMRFSLAYDGFELGKRFSEQRDYLTRQYRGINSDIEKENFVHWLSDLTEYWNNIFIPRQPNRNSRNFQLAQYLANLGLDLPDADLSALCIYYLKGANHGMAHYLLSVFYSKLLRSQSNATEKAAAATEFFEICKTTTAFFTLWGATVPGFPDDIYRFLFSQDRSNLSWKSGVNNQNAIFVKEHFKKALEDKGVFALGSKSAAKNAWVNKAIVQLGYGKKKLCKFCLFIASHDTSPDIISGNEGLLVKGNPGTSTYLTCAKWFSDDLEIIEHIANREKPDPPYNYGAPDPNLYPGDHSIVDRIGNLTLWPRSDNSSTYSEWPDKVYYYSTLTSLTPQRLVDLEILKTNLGITKVPPKLAGKLASSTYIPNLAPLALRGQKGGTWDKNFVDKRSKVLCELIFDFLYEWIN